MTVLRTSSNPFQRVYSTEVTQLYSYRVYGPIISYAHLSRPFSQQEKGDIKSRPILVLSSLQYIGKTKKNPPPMMFGSGFLKVSGCASCYSNLAPESRITTTNALLWCQ